MCGSNGFQLVFGVVVAVADGLVCAERYLKLMECLAKNKNRHLSIHTAGMTDLTSSLLLSSNELTGPIPTQLGGMNLNTVLYLFSNELCGDIPSEVDALSTYVFVSNFRFRFRFRPRLRSIQLSNAQNHDRSKQLTRASDDVMPTFSF